MIGDDDLAAGVFFDLADFAVQMVRSRAGVDDLSFSAIVGESDEEALDGRAVAAHRSALFAAGLDVRKGDAVAVTTGPCAGSYRVNDCRAVNDGQELKAWLKKVSP